MANLNETAEKIQGSEYASKREQSDWIAQAKQSLKRRGYVAPENRSYELKLKNGKTFGTVGYEAYKAVQNNTLDKYAPKNSDEKRTLDDFKKYVKEQTEKQKKAEKQARINSNPVTKKYGIDPATFKFTDLVDWAKKHNYKVELADIDSLMKVNFTPKYEDGILGLGGKKLTTDQEDEDVKVLEQIASNNTRKDLSQKDTGALSSAVIGLGEGLSFGAANALAERKTKKNYEKAGLNPDEYVSLRETQAKTVGEHNKTNILGNIAGSVVSTGGLSKAVGAATTAVSATRIGEAVRGVKWISQSAPWIERAITDGITFGISSGTRTAFGGGTFEDVLKSSVRGGVSGAAGGVASVTASRAIDSLLTNPRYADAFWGQIKNKIGTYYAKNAVVGLADATADNLTDAAMSKATDTEKRKAGDVALDFGVTLILGMLKTATSNKEATSVSKKYIQREVEQYCKDYEALNNAAKKTQDLQGYSDIGNGIIQRGENLKKFLQGHIFTGAQDLVDSVSEKIDYVNAGIREKIAYAEDITKTKSRATAENVNTAGANSSPVSSSSFDTPTVTSVAAETAAQKNTPTVDTNIPTVDTKSNTTGELGEIMNSGSIAVFTPETASDEIKGLENILIAKGADDTSRKGIIDTAIEIEKTLDGSDKNIRSVFNDVSKITSTAISEIQRRAGLSSSYWRLFDENFKTVSTGNAKENISLVTEYSNAYAEALKNSNPEKYNSVMLSADGKDLSAELPKTVMRNVIPNTVQNAEQYRITAAHIKNIINAANAQLENERNEIYGENAVASVENGAKITEAQTVIEPKNITLSRLGDFYEAFGDEATELAGKLNLTPTYKTVNGVKTAVVGFPAHVLEKYRGALGNDYNLIISDNAADTITDNTSAAVQNQAVSDETDVIDHTKGIKGLKLIDAEKSTLLDGKTLVTGVYELNSDKDFNRKSYKKEKFDIFSGQEPYVKSVEGITYGHYGAAGNKSNGYTITYLPAGVGVAKTDTQTKAKALLKALESNLPELPLTIKAYADGYRCYGIDEAVKESVSNVVNSVTENTDEITFPLKNKKELISYLKNHIGGRIGVTYNNGTEDVRTVVNASDTAIVTERTNGQRGRLSAKADELSYTDSGFVYTGSNGVTVSYRFISENTSSEDTATDTVTKTADNKGAVPYTDREKQNWEKSKDIIVYESNEQFEAFVERVLKNEDTYKKIYFGKIPTDTVQMVLEKTGIDVSEHNIALKGYEIRKILLNSHGNENTENARGQEPITVDDLKNIPSVITAPDNVSLSGKEYEGKPALLFEKTIDGKNYVVAYVSRKHHDIAIQTMYKKRSLATAENANALSSTPETTSSTASNDIVSQDNDTVNSANNNLAQNKPDLKSGDVIETNGKKWRVTQTGFNMSFENLDKSDKQSVFSYIGGMDNFKATHDYKLISDNIGTAVAAENGKNIPETQTKTEEALKKEPESDTIKKNPTTQIAEYVNDKLSKGEKITALELSKVSSEAFGGTMADNTYSIKDAYDAMELGVNKYILSMKDVSTEKMLELLELLPTQTKRTEEMVKYQQFSTPPSIAYLANYAANICPKDIMLEPSAGIGGIAVFAKRDGATVYVNELDNRRFEILKNMPFDRFFNENAEQLDNILGGEIEPSVIVMNPPFSSSSERNIQNTKIGAKHIEQALKILAPNGRLVAIVGHGMGDDAPAFRNWWKDIKSQYDVKANFRINGKNYNKYGTNFDIQMLVIDKNGATTHTETEYVNTLQELQEKLEVIRDERPVFNYSGNEQRTPATARTKAVKTGKTVTGGNSTLSDTNGIADTGKSANNTIAERKSVGKDIQSASEQSGTVADRKPENTDVVADTNGRMGSRKSSGLARKDNTDRVDNSISGQSDLPTGRNGVRVRLKKKELTDSIFEQYQTQPLTVKNAKHHPGKVSESAAMSAIEPPVITYKPNIPQNVIESGILSDVQLEAISYAGQSHSQTLPDGTARGFFLGDGTGIGKGRTIAGMILDNYNQGRKKSLWVTLNPSLVNDAKRDVKAVFGNSDLVTQFVGGKKADSVLSADEAVMVVSYPSLSTGYDNTGSNFEKIVNWLGKDFDGLIVFDESHKMGNAKATKGTRGTKQASQTGLAGIALQEALPKAKIVYSSATGATEVENLRYAERLGLWGEGTAFATGDDFVSKIKAGGLAAMELIARDMKAMGVYLSRNISYEDVRYDKITHKLSREQKKIYDELARSWQIVLSNINKALEGTNQNKDGKARGKALSAFWSSQQRFFNQILTSMQVPSVISDIEKQLADGKSCVIQLVSTNEAAQNEEFARLKENDLELDEFDLTPKQMLMSYIENSFPVQQFEEYRDDDGNVRSKPVFDSKGNPVLNRDAVRQREELLSKLGSIKVPSSPIDMIINHFGTDMVAENTGRARRVVQKDGKLIEEKIGSKKDADVDAFQNGKKRIIIFSKAGGTGKSYHADRAAKNQQQRVHYLLEAGWQADNAVQGFGRSHRSNQAIAPIFKLVTTDLKGQMRFISTIAKRLDQLGAMTKGQRQAGGQGMFSASDNLENSFAADVLAVFYKDLILNRVDGIDDGLEIISKLGLKDKILNEYNQVMPNAPELREVNKFLNRILSLESSEQNIVFEGYQQRLQDATEKAMLAGTLDKGLENYKADRITLNEVKDIREDERSGAKTKYYNLTAEHKIKPVKFEDIPTESKSFVGYYQNKTTGNVRAVVRTSSTTDQYGNVTDNFKLIGQVKNDYIAQNRFYGNWTEIKADEAEKLWNEEITKLPEYRKESLHLISGAVLPVWDKLPTENVRIYRVLTSDGEMLIGRVIPEDRIDEVLRRLGSSRKKEKIVTKDLISGIKNGDTVYLENDWKIVQRKVSGENRIEVVGPTYENYDSLTKKGVFTERIQYNTRYFVPANTNTEKIIDEVLKVSPVMRVENAKYSISESEELSNEQSGSSILSGNSGRAVNASTGKQARRVSNYKQKLEGKTATERKNTAKELTVKGYAEEVVNGNHKYTLIKDEGYNDDMRSIVSEAKAYGKEVGFFIGNAVRKFDGQRNFKIDGIKLANNKILIRYDGAYSPQALLMHELVHTEWDNPEMQKAKDIILSDLSDSEKKEILQNGRYKDYMELYGGDEEAVWEEFIADVFADMNNYSDDYIDTAVDYWYNDKVIDRYNPSEYIKSIDAGGNEAVLDNIGFGNEYSLNNHTPKIKLSKQEYALVSKAVMAKNAGKTDSELKPVDFVYAADEFYVYENHSIGEFSVINKYDVETEYERIDVLRGLINNGIHSNTDGERLNRLIDDVRRGKGSHSRNNGGAENGRYAMANDGISGEQQRSNSIGHSSGIGANNRVKYALNSHDTDSESLTPERKKEIFEQWKKDRAEIEKPTQRQLWGERAKWVAHNATRVFPNIPERGEKGTFFAEFRKDMIQWKNLPTTASFMVLDKLNKMTEGLTPEEYKTFSELVYFLDLQEEAQIQKDRGYDKILLPNEITPKEVDEIVKVLNEEATDKVQQALIKRQNIWDELKQQYIDLNSYIGFDTDGKFKRKNYYHHQVIDYINNDKGGTGSREIGIKAGRGWLKERQGSTKAINTDFLMVENKALLQMQYDVYIAETLGNIKQQYDIKPKLEKEAFEHNKKALNDIIQKECTDEKGNVMLDKNGNPDSETYRKQKWYNARIMWGFNGLFDLAERGELSDYDGEYTNVIEAFKKHDLNADGLYKYVGILSNIELPDNATDGQEQAVQNARTILKYTAQKKAWIKELLADDYQTWETLAKSMGDTHSIHQPRRGNYFYTKTILDEDAFNKAHEDMVLSLISGEVDLGNVDVKKLFEQYSDTVRLTGAAYEQWVLPKEIVTTMDEIANPKQVHEVLMAARGIVSAWKGWVTTLNPFKTVKFFKRNLVGDLDAVIAGNPKVTLYSKQAVQEIYRAMKHKNYSDDFMEWVKRGGYTSMIFADEMDTEMQDKLFSYLKDKHGTSVFKIPVKFFEKYSDGVENVHNFREAILRYSAYLYFKDEISKNGGNVKDYVASNKYIVKGLNSTEDKAYQLSKDLLGAYDEVGKLGQTLRRYWIPFYSFPETNMKRYYRMFENIITSDDEIPKKAGKLLLKALMANMLMLITIAWNKLVMKEQDDKLPPSTRDIPHITFGQIGDNTYAFRQLGSFSELLEWVGLDDYKWTKEDLTAPVDKAWGMITPFVKMPVELASGLNFYPSLTQPRAIRDKWGHLFNTLGVDKVYNMVSGKPTRGVTQSPLRGIGEVLKDAFIYSYDYKESAYYEILDIKREWQESDSGSIYKPTKKSNALYYMKTAVRYKDKKAALKYIDEYFENGGTGKGIKQSIAPLNPMYGFTGKDTVEKGKEFIASLSDEEKEKLKIAQEFYENDLMLPQEVADKLGKKDITDEEAKNLLRNYVNAKCK